jgi:hypothetical protein
MILLLLEDNTNTTSVTSISAMTKNPPFKWVMGQPKEFGIVVGAWR